MENLIQPSETTSTQSGEAATPNNQHEADTEMVDIPENIDAPPPQVDYCPATNEDNAMVDAENERTHYNNVASEEEESTVKAGIERTETRTDGREQSDGRQSTIRDPEDAQDAVTEVYTRTENYDNEEANDEEIDEENNEESSEENDIRNNNEDNEEDVDDITPEREET